MTSEAGRFFEVSKLRLGPDGHVSDVLWREVNAASNLDVSEAVVVPVADVVDALHDGAAVAALFSTRSEHLPDRSFVVFEHDNGTEGIALGDPPTPGRELADIANLDD
jgi:hypothetical protein